VSLSQLYRVLVSDNNDLFSVDALETSDVLLESSNAL